MNYGNKGSKKRETNNNVSFDNHSFDSLSVANGDMLEHECITEEFWPNEDSKGFTVGNLRFSGEVIRDDNNGFVGAKFRICSKVKRKTETIRYTRRNR